ncbi:MAG: hypothetical protein R3Y53_11685 [Bacillota bacterium]
MKDFTTSPPRQADDVVGFAKQSELTNENREVLVAQENIGELFFKEQEQERKEEEIQKARKKKQSQDR